MPESEFVSIGVIMERRSLDSPWQDHEWRVAGLVTGAPGGAEGEPVSDAAGLVRYHAGTGALSLHTTEVSGYIENLTSPQASLYVVLRRGEAKDGGRPWVVERVTANPYEAQDYLPSDDVLVEKVAMPEEVKLWVEAFVAAHYREEPFRKRRRDKVVIEEHKFGHEPIVELRRRRRAAGEDEG